MGGLVVQCIGHLTRNKEVADFTPSHGTAA